MKKYGLVKISENDEMSIICSWNENIVNRLVDDLTNTVGVKTVRDLVTGIYIKPDPIELVDNDSVNVRIPKTLTYVTYPSELSIDEVVKRLTELRSNPIELKKYIDYIKLKQQTAYMDHNIHKLR